VAGGGVGSDRLEREMSSLGGGGGGGV